MMISKMIIQIIMKKMIIFTMILNRTNMKIIHNKIMILIRIKCIIFKMIAISIIIRIIESLIIRCMKI